MSDTNAPVVVTKAGGLDWTAVSDCLRFLDKAVGEGIILDDLDGHNIWNRLIHSVDVGAESEDEFAYAILTALRAQPAPQADEWTTLEAENAALKARVGELEGENFRLAAGACINPGQHGLVGDEGGNAICTAYEELQREQTADSETLAALNESQRHDGPTRPDRAGE